MFNRRDLLRLIIPLIIEQVLAVTIGMADTVMVASVGEAAVSGISLVDTINILLINIFSALATGGSVVASQYIGRGDHENACAAAKQLILSIASLSILIGALSLAFCPQILRMIFGGVDAEVMDNSKTYFYLSAVSYPFLGIFNAGAALYRAMGNSKVPMMTSVLMNLINVTGNAVLIFQFHWGVAGAGTATLLSRLTGAVIMIFLIKKHNHIIYVDNFLKPPYHFRMLKGILRIGVPNGLENGIFQLGKILVQGLVASFGTAAIAANAVANTVAGMEVIPGSAIGLALITVVGQCIGAGDPKQAKAYAIKLMKLTYLLMAFLNIVILFAVPAITGFYGLSEETSRIASQLMWCHGAFCILIWPLSFTLPNALRAAGDAKFTMVVSIVSMWTCRIGLSYVFGLWLGGGVLGVWLAMICDWTVRSTLFVGRFLRGKWMQKRVL